MTMITIQKLPSLEPEMRGALRRHIMRKRQRLKQEMEQDAIEKRLKKEREQKRIQDAMTLDQIKEQLSTLEKRLETLRSEKHDLFVQLKQVLNEGSSKRKQSDAAPAPSPADQQKKAKTEDDTGSKTAPSVVPPPGPVPSAATTTTVSKPVSNDIGPSSSKPPSALTSNIADRSERFVPLDKPQELNRQPENVQSPRQIPTLSPRTQASTSFDSRIANHHYSQMGSSMPMIGMPPMMNHNQINLSPYKFSEPPTGFSRHESLPPMPPTSSSTMSPQNLAAIQAQFRNSFGGVGGGESLPSLPPELLMMSQRLNSNFQKLPPLGPHKLPLNTLPMSIPSSLPQGQHDVLSNAKSFGPNLNQLTASQTEDILPALKKAGNLPGFPSSSFAGHPNQISLDHELPPHLAHLALLNHGLPLTSLDASTSIATSLPGIGPGMVAGNFNPRGGAPLPHQFSRAQLDFLNRPGGPGSSSSSSSGTMGPGGQPMRLNLLLPGLSPFHYPAHSSPSLQVPSSMYSGADFNHQLFQASLAQRMSSPMIPFNLTPQQQQQLHQSQLQQLQSEQANRLFASNPGNYHRRSSPKNQYFPNR